MNLAMPSFFLHPSPRTLELVQKPVAYGAWWDGWPGFQQTHWSHLQHALVHSFASHRWRTSNASTAQACVVASPVRGRCERWNEICPGKRLIVIAATDADITLKLCHTLWSNCAQMVRRDIVRIVGNTPRLRNRTKMPCGPALLNTLSVPYLSHCRRINSTLFDFERTPRPVRVAMAFAIHGHKGAKNWGVLDWRTELRTACSDARRASNECGWVWPSMGGKNARDAVDLYRRSVFCLQPPGDSFARPGIVDAVSVGCIPVLFHQAQAELWPWHWDASEAAVTYDWADPSQRSGEAVMKSLLALPEQRVQALQRGLARAASRLVYRGESGASASAETEGNDAFETLVRGLLQQERRVPAGRSLEYVPIRPSWAGGNATRGAVAAPLGSVHSIDRSVYAGT